jgi:hypothetical protein
MRPPQNWNHVILDTLLFVDAENIDSWLQEGEFVVCFSSSIMMVHSSILAVATDDEWLTCSSFSLTETIHFGTLEFIADYFNSMSLSPKGSNSSTIFMGTTYNRSP